MRFLELWRTWGQEAGGELADETFAIRLPLEHAAKLEALAELFPLRSREQITCELLAAALDEMVENIPYVQGSRIIARDEEGDPVYEDVGDTPRYLELVRKHVERLRGD